MAEKKVVSIFFLEAHAPKHTKVLTFDLIFEDGSVFPSGYANTYPAGECRLPSLLGKEEASKLGDLLIKAKLVNRVLFGP